jgi:hypothetical protein
MTLPPVFASGPRQHLRRIHASRSPELAIKFYSKPPHIPPVSSPAASTTRAVTVWNALQPSETGATGCASPASPNPNHARPSRANDSKTTLPLARLHPLHPSPVDARPSRDPSSLSAATGSVNVSGSSRIFSLLLLVVCWALLRHSLYDSWLLPTNKTTRLFLQSGEHCRLACFETGLGSSKHPRRTCQP